MEDDGYLLVALRYIHLNPVKAGLCKTPIDYPYSSYSAYIRGDGIVDTALILDMVGRDGFVEYHKQDTDERCMDVSDDHRRRLPDGKAIELIRRMGCDTPQDYLKLEPEEQRAGIQMLIKRGASIRQASRLTGVSCARVRQYAQSQNHGENQRDGSQ